MQGKLPASIAGVAESFREAESYETLQWQRRRGAYGVLVGLVTLALGIAPLLVGTEWAFAGALAFFAAMVPVALVLRRRPAWKGVFLENGKDLLQLLSPSTSRWPKWVRFLVLFVVLLGLMIATDLAREDVGTWLRIAVFSGMMSVALRELKDWPMFWAALASIAATGMFLLFPVRLDLTFCWYLMLGAAFLAIGLVRVLAPRRWLVR